MAITDYLNNISSWKQAPLKSIAYFEQMIEQCFKGEMRNYSPTRRHFRYNQWYAGTFSNSRIPSSWASQLIKNAPNTYITNTSVADIAEGRTDGYKLLKTFMNLNGGQLIAYLDIITCEKALNEATRNTGYRTHSYVKNSNFAGIAIEEHDGFIYFANACGPFMEVQPVETAMTPYKPVLMEDEISSKYYTLKNVYFYFVSQDNKRVQVENVAPTFVWTFNNVYVASRMLWGRGTLKDVKTLLAPCEAIQQITLCSGFTRTNGQFASAIINNNLLAATDNNVDISFPVGNSVGLNNTGEGGFFPFMGKYKSLIGAKCSGGEPGSIPDKIVDVTNTLEIDTPPFDFEYLTMVAKDRTNMMPRGFLIKDGNKRYLSLSGNVTICCAKDPQTFIDLFADWGIYATTNIDEIKYGDIPNLPFDNPTGGDSGYDPNLPTTGVGENTIPKPIPNDPINRIDDFTVKQPNIIPASLCDSYIYNFPQVRQLFNWFCSVGYIKNQSELFADKLSAIYGLMLFPFDLLQHDSAHLTPTDITNIVSVSQNISGYILEPNYNTIVYGGELQYLSYYGNFMDWEKCKYSVYIPYGGIVEIPSAAVVNRKLVLQYSVDLLTGKSTAILKSYALGNDTLGVLVKLIPCQIGHLVPVQANNYAQREVSNTLAAISMASNLLNSAAGITAGAVRATTDPTKVGGAVGNAIATGLSTATGLFEDLTEWKFNQQLTYCATGSVSPTSGLGLPQTPFLSISRSHAIEPTNYKSIMGIPTEYYAQLQTVATGNNFVQMLNAYVKIPNASNEEINEIRNLLETGIYV